MPSVNAHPLRRRPSLSSSAQEKLWKLWARAAIVFTVSSFRFATPSHVLADSLSSSGLAPHSRPDLSSEKQSDASAMFRQYAPIETSASVMSALMLHRIFSRELSKGKATFTFKPIASPLEELKLDGVDLTIKHVDSSAKVSYFAATTKRL